MKRLMVLIAVAAAFSACLDKEGKVIAHVGSEKITDSYLQEQFAEISGSC